MLRQRSRDLWTYVISRIHLDVEAGFEQQFSSDTSPFHLCPLKKTLGIQKGQVTRLLHDGLGSGPGQASGGVGYWAPGTSQGQRLRPGQVSR